MSINKLIEKIPEEEKQKCLEVIAVCKSPEELIKKANELGYKITKKDAKELLEDFAAKALANSKQMTEDELENVAAGGCGCGNCDQCEHCGNC